MATITGTSGNDWLVGTTGIDQIYGFQGVDTIVGSAGADRIDGGQDNQFLGDAVGDTVDYSRSNGAVQIDLRQVLQYGGHAEGDQLYNIENVVGSIYGDSLQASELTKLLEGGRGADTIYGWAGQGTASYAGSKRPVEIDLNVVTQHGGDAEGDQLYNIHRVLGSAYDDIILGDTSSNILTGGGGNDTFRGRLNNDTIDGGDGSDTVLLDTFNQSGVTVSLTDGGPFGPGYAWYANGEQDTLVNIENLVGTKYIDMLWGNSADNTFDGMGSGDDMHGGGGRDTLRGGSGDDRLYGDAGRDKLFGDANNDWLVGGGDADTLDGGDGIDTASYESSSAGVTVSLLPGVVGQGGDAQGDTLVRIEHLTGSGYDDALTGDDFGNILNGGIGNDTLIGGGGRDTLIGGKGDDVMSGGMDGAKDIFVFEMFNEGSQLNIGNDRINDWESFDELRFQNASPNMNVNVTQVGNDTVLTIDNVLGSITILDAQASQFDYL
jgi:Ca2+-binding RTX toxin-like protein